MINFIEKLFDKLFSTEMLVVLAFAMISTFLFEIHDRNTGGWLTLIDAVHFAFLLGAGGFLNQKFRS